MREPALLRSIGTGYTDDAAIASAGYLDTPRIAAHLAVLNEAAADVRLDVDFQVLAAKRARYPEVVWHGDQSYRTTRAAAR